MTLISLQYPCSAHKMFSLQRQVFAEGDQRLLAVVRVVKPGRRDKKGKQSLLCVTGRITCSHGLSFGCLLVSLTLPTFLTEAVNSGQVLLHKVKVGSSGEDSYQLRRSWNLEELPLIDGLSPNGSEFVLHTADKPLKWVAATATDKTNFLQSLLKVRHHCYRPWALVHLFQPEGGASTCVANHLVQRHSTLFLMYCACLTVVGASRSRQSTSRSPRPLRMWATTAQMNPGLQSQLLPKTA